MANDWNSWLLNGWPPKSGGDGGGTATATPKPVKHGTESELWDLASGIEAEEGRRYEQGLGTLTGAYNKAQDAFKPVDSSLLFSRATDAIGARGAANMDALRRSLGARGLNPNSGAANGVLSRLMFENNNAVTGATRDIAIENQKQRQINAAQSFAAAMNLANFQNSPVSGAKSETSQNIFEGDLTREGIKAQAKAQKSANKTNLIGAGIGLVGSVLGGLL